MKLRLDFETFSELDIKKVGAHKYARHESTEVLMAAYWIDDERYFWDATVNPEIPQNLFNALTDPTCLIYAFNAQFERLILAYVLGICLPVKMFRCTLVRAYELSFKGSLHQVGEQMEIDPALLKYATEGRKLINKFCKPAPTNHKVDRYTRENSPEKWEEFCGYCRQDVVAEAAIDDFCDQYYPTSEFEQDLYALDQKINDRGVPVDRQMIDAAIRIAKQVKKDLIKRLKKFTGLDNPNSNAQLIPWLTGWGVEVPTKWSTAKNEMAYTLDKDAVIALLKTWQEMTPTTLGTQNIRKDILEVLTLKQQISKTSVSKYNAFAKAEEDGIVRGMFQMNGASRTDRWAGRVVQLHNLARPKIEDLETAAQFVKTGNAQLLEMMYGDPLDTLSSCTRAVIKAPEGECWNVSDLGSIESRILGWQTGCEWINGIFAAGKDTYKSFAAELFGVPYDQITKAQRDYSKPPFLGCGFRLGGVGLVKYAGGMGVEMSKKEGFRAVKTFRCKCPEVVALWYWLEGAIAAAVQQGAVGTGYGVRIWVEKDMLCIQLASGRVLYYHKPLIEIVAVTFEDELGRKKTIEKPCFTHMGTDKFRPQDWARISAHGGVITENVVQATARDVLAVWLTRADQAGFDLRLHVHDELGATDKNNRLEALNCLIRQPVSWAPGLLLDASGYVATRYRKD